MINDIGDLPSELPCHDPQQAVRPSSLEPLNLCTSLALDENPWSYDGHIIADVRCLIE